MATKQDFLSNTAWVKRVGELFHVSDVNKNGYLQLEDYEIVITNLTRLTNNERPALIEKAREVVLEMTDSLGLKKGVKLNKEQYLDAMAAMGVEQGAKVKQGEASITTKLNNAVFDVVDVNRDGTVSLSEYKLVFKAFNIDEASAAEGYAVLDRNKDGKVSRQEFNDTETNFWWSLDDPKSKGIMGSNFEA